MAPGSPALPAGVAVPPVPATSPPFSSRSSEHNPPAVCPAPPGVLHAISSMAGMASGSNTLKCTERWPDEEFTTSSSNKTLATTAGRLKNQPLSHPWSAGASSNARATASSTDTSKDVCWMERRPLASEATVISHPPSFKQCLQLRSTWRYAKHLKSVSALLPLPQRTFRSAKPKSTPSRSRWPRARTPRTTLCNAIAAAARCPAARSVRLWNQRCKRRTAMPMRSARRRRSQQRAATRHVKRWILVAA
mmetsp:Transcript_68792/g.173321  ORF Transcript_68792/g.173321 Transcript_68792/m.173321 type:complete len:249 (+) Transcript_68792:141-887(+)